MKTRTVLVLLIFVFMALLPMEMACSNAATSLNEAANDLSTPEKAINMFFEAFRTGNDSLLDRVLAPGASIPEFNPMQKIVSPYPHIGEVVINRIDMVNERRRYAAPDSYTKPSDLEVRVTIKYDPQFMSVTEGREIFLLRKIDSKWKIIAEVLFWPEDIEEMRKK